MSRIYLDALMIYALASRALDRFKFKRDAGSIFVAVLGIARLRMPLPKGRGPCRIAASAINHAAGDLVLAASRADRQQTRFHVLYNLLLGPPLQTARRSQSEDQPGHRHRSAPL